VQAPGARPGRGARACAGGAARWLGRPSRPLPANSGAIVPEVFSPAVAQALPELFAQAGGACVAVFHDAVALQYPEFTPPGTVARFPAYLQELLAFDGIAAVSESSRAALVDYWSWLGIRTAPPVVAIPLGVDPPPAPLPTGAGADAGPPIVLVVGTLEGRKNHLALLEACEHLWAGGANFRLRIVGRIQPQTGRAAARRLEELRTAGRPIQYDGILDDRTLAAAYAACAFTVYPSLAEGFGLPVLESLAHGRPCVCSARGATGESARGGGLPRARRGRLPCARRGDRPPARVPGRGRSPGGRGADTAFFAPGTTTRLTSWPGSALSPQRRDRRFPPFRLP
jgi:glycosyltransferase involved in cell wall biosynthesis